MAKTLRFTTNLRGPAIVKARIDDVIVTDYALKYVIVGIELSTNADARQPTLWKLRLTNTVSDCILDTPTAALGISLATVPTPSLFNQVQAAIAAAITGGTDHEGAILGLMATAGCLPPGTLA